MGGARKLAVVIALGVLAFTAPAFGMCVQQEPVVGMLRLQPSSDEAPCAPAPCCTSGPWGPGTVCVEVVRLEPVDVTRNPELAPRFATLLDTMRHAVDDNDDDPFSMPIPVPGIGKVIQLFH